MRSSTASAPWICSTKDNNSVNTIPFMTNSSIRAATNRIDCIPRSRQYPKILWIDDAEVVGDGITKASPVLGDFVAQEIERDVRELSACGVAFVVRYIPVHEPP